LSDGNNAIVTYNGWRPTGLDRDLHEAFFYSGANTSSGFVQQPHKHPQRIVASIGHPKATQCH
jgi:hypothetical protein